MMRSVQEANNPALRMPRDLKSGNVKGFARLTRRRGASDQGQPRAIGARRLGWWASSDFRLGWGRQTTSQNYQRAAFGGYKIVLRSKNLGEICVFDDSRASLPPLDH